MLAYWQTRIQALNVKIEQSKNFADYCNYFEYKFFFLSTLFCVFSTAWNLWCYHQPRKVYRFHFLILQAEIYEMKATFVLSKSAHITTNLFWMICSISLPITILNRLVILNDDISTEEIEITCSVIGVFRLPELDQVLILVQRSLSYCMTEDSIVKTGRHADVILLA